MHIISFLETFFFGGPLIPLVVQVLELKIMLRVVTHCNMIQDIISLVFNIYIYIIIGYVRDRETDKTIFFRIVGYIIVSFLLRCNFNFRLKNMII
jgi:hypothetical protein